MPFFLKKKKKQNQNNNQKTNPTKLQSNQNTQTVPQNKTVQVQQYF